MPNARSIVLLARQSLRKNGVVGTLAKAPVFARFVVGEITNLPKTRRFWRIEREDGFDARWGTDTSSQNVFLSTLTDNESVQHATSYWPAHVRDFRVMLDAVLDHADPTVRVDPSATVFVDVGCGKGRVVLVASEHPFTHLYGVDFAASLIDVAEANLGLYDGGAQKTRVSFVCDDALRWPFPTEPLLLYLFHPFGPEVLTPFVERLIASADASPRAITVIYAHPVHLDVFERTGRFSVERNRGNRLEHPYAILALRR